MTETIFELLNDVKEDTTLILERKIADEVVDILIDQDEIFMQEEAEIIRVIENNEIVQISRLIGSNGKSIYFVFEVEEEMIESEFVVIQHDLLLSVDPDYIKADFITVLFDEDEDESSRCNQCAAVEEALETLADAAATAQSIDGFMNSVEDALRALYVAGYEDGMLSIRDHINDTIFE